MPYGDLNKMAVQRFSTKADLDRYGSTIEEREEYEPHLEAGNIVYSGVDYEKILKQAFEKAKKTKPKLKVSTKLLEGRPSEKIVEEAKAEGIDAIIMGSRGLGGIKEFFLGSASHRVADQAPCPVLIVKFL
jgi:nucleotide-binding universal stress UspA family protein